MIVFRFLWLCLVMYIIHKFRKCPMFYLFPCIFVLTAFYFSFYYNPVEKTVFIKKFSTLIFYINLADHHKV